MTKRWKSIGPPLNCYFQILGGVIAQVIWIGDSKCDEHVFHHPIIKTQEPILIYK